jgi:hypothetical protein
MRKRQEWMMMKVEKDKKSIISLKIETLLILVKTVIRLH